MKVLEGYIFYSILLLPVALVSGPFLSDLIISSSGIVFLYILFKKKIFYKVIFSNNLYNLFFIWCLYLILRSLFSDYIKLSLEASLFYFRFGIFSILVCYLCETKKKFIKKFSISLIFTFLILILDGFFQFFLGYNIIGIVSSLDRVSSFFGEEKILGSFLSRLFPIFFALFLYVFSKYKYASLFLFSLLVFTDVLIYISGDRTAFFYLLLFTLMTLILSSNFKKLRLFSFSVSFILIISVTIFFPQIKDRIITKTISEFQIKETVNTDYVKNKNINQIIEDKFRFNLFTITHTKMYLTGLNIFFDNIFFGTGTKTYRKVCDDDLYSFYDGCLNHPHNTYIQLLSETGIIGSVPVICVFLFLIFTFCKILLSKLFSTKSIYSDNYIYFLSALMISLFPLVPTGNFFNNWLSIIYYLPIGFMLYFSKNIKST